MAFRPNVSQQMSMSDNLYNLSKRGQKMLKRSWAEDFANHIFPNLPEEPFSVLFSDNEASKPNAPINVITSVCSTSTALLKNSMIKPPVNLIYFCCGSRLPPRKKGHKKTAVYQTAAQIGGSLARYMDIPPFLCGFRFYFPDSLHVPGVVLDFVKVKGFVRRDGRARTAQTVKVFANVKGVCLVKV